jgi:hypothetical protein
VLEAVLISAGVFLALLGEQWREDAQHRALAGASLRNFRSEITANREALAAVVDYHTDTRANLEAYFASDRPRTAAAFDVPIERGLGPVYFEETAWELAVANQSLGYIDPDLAVALSRVYTLQRAYVTQQAAIVQSTIYARSWTQDVEGFWRPVLYYLSDLAHLDPTLMRAYDEAILRLDQASGRGSDGSRSPQ